MNEYQPFSLLKPFAHVCLSEKASQQFHLLKMKRTAMEAHLPDAPRRLFLYITMPQDHWGQQMTFTLQCNSNDTVDDAKRSLQSMIWDAMVPQAFRIPIPARWEAYSLHQTGH